MRTVTPTMLAWLDRIRRGHTCYLGSVPIATKRALVSRVLVYSDPSTRRAKLTRDGKLVCAGAAAARRAYRAEWD